MTMKPISTLLAACAAALLLSACGGDKSDKSTADMAPPVTGDPMVTASPAVSTVAPVAETTATEQAATPTPAPTATATPQPSPTRPVAAEATTAAMAMQPPADVRAAITPAPTPVVDPATPPAESLTAVREQLRGLDLLSSPKIPADKNAVMQAHLAHIAEMGDAKYNKYPGEDISDLAGKIRYQLDEALNATNPDETIRRMKGVEEKLTKIEEEIPKLF